MTTETEQLITKLRKVQHGDLSPITRRNCGLCTNILFLYEAYSETCYNIMKDWPKSKNSHFPIEGSEGYYSKLANHFDMYIGGDGALRMELAGYIADKLEGLGELGEES